MKRGGGAGVFACGAIVLLTLAAPRFPGDEPRLPGVKQPPLLEVEALYPSPLRTALEIEPRYAQHESDAAAAPAGLLALTFDTEIPRGGEARQTVNEILDVLHHENVRATFFVVGTWARANTQVLQRMAAEGHEIANHSFDHRPFARRRTADVQRDLDRVAELVETATGAPIAPIFRPPYGCVDGTAERAARARGYALAGWTAAGRDAAGETSSALEVVEQLDADLEPGAVVLLHTNRWITAAALPLILDRAREKGLAPVTLSASLARDASRRDELARRAMRPCAAVFAARTHRFSRRG